MKLKVPPVLVMFIFGVSMFLLATYLPIGHFDFFGRALLMYVLLSGALGIGLISLYQFYQRKTTISPLTPEKVSYLVTGGIYKYTRNPMYLALLLLLLAWGLYLGNAFNMLVAAGFVSYMNRFQIIPEEMVLTNRFGKDYQKYLIQVRRWF